LQQQLDYQTQAELIAEITELQQQINTNQQRLEKYQVQGEELTTEFISLHERQQQQTQQLQMLAEKKYEQEKKLQQALNDSVFDSEEAMRLAYEEIAILPSLQEKLTSYHQEVTVIKRRLQDLERLIIDKQPDVTYLQEQYDLAEQEMTALQTQIIQQEETLQSNRQLLQELQTLTLQSAEQVAEMSQLQQLSQTLNGDNPEKISIERYVLQSFLAEILAVANQRLSKLTRGRYQFLLANKKGSYRSSTGLEINIYDDNAGMSRRAHTLSGGESFIAALALALSLADVIQNRAGGIAIEALFIDEGFGSLDEESLEMAMEALEIIENEGRMIGIISHVRELKDRIQQQLIVQTNGSGQSHIKSQVV
jgi:exonuclease SbcC